MPKFRVRGGKVVNQGGDGKTYRKGAVLESPYDCDVKWPNKFIRVPDTTPTGPAEGDPDKPTINQDMTLTVGDAKVVPPPDMSDEEQAEWLAMMEERRIKAGGKPGINENTEVQKEKTEENALDVTSDFPTAKEADLVVKKIGKMYYVAEKDAKPGVYINKEGSSNKRAVTEIIAAQTVDPDKGQ